MTTVSIVDLRERLTDVVNTVFYKKERVILMRHDKPVVAIVPLEDYELLEALEDRLDLGNGPGGAQRPPSRVPGLGQCESRSVIHLAAGLLHPD